MQTQLTLNVDNQIIELANFYAKERGVSLNDFFEYSIRLIIINEQLNKLKNIDFTNLFSKTEIKTETKKTNWKELDKRLMNIRHGLPIDYKFDRELANER